MTQRRKFLEIAAEYEALGGGPCDHRNTDNEYDLGSDTGDIGCLTCGATWWRDSDPPVRRASVERADAQYFLNTDARR